MTNDRKLWMGILRQTRPYFELVRKQFVTVQFANETSTFDAERIFLENYCDFVENHEDFCSQNVIKIFKRIQMIHIALQDVIQDSPDYEVFQKEFIGQKLAGEVQLQMNKVEKDKQQDSKLCVDVFDFKSSFDWLLKSVISVIECREKIKFIEERKIFFDQDNENLYDQMLEAMKKRLEICEKLLLIGILITVRDSCADV